MVLEITALVNSMLLRGDIITTIGQVYLKPNHRNISKEDLLQYIKSAEFLEDILRFSRTAFLIVDCKRWRYLYCSANANEVLGWETQEFMNGGPVFGLTRLLPEDLTTQSSIHPLMINYLKTIPGREWHLYKFSFTSRLRQKGGQVVNLLQNNIFLKSDTDGQPLLKLITFTDVSAYKTTSDVVYYITRSSSRTKNEIILQKSFSGVHDIEITNRELAVINASADGLSSASIATKMRISINTLKNHKKNIHRKLGCVNACQMIALATLYGLISSRGRAKVLRKISKDF